MASIDIARTVLLLMAGLLLAGPGSTTERMPPADHCLDARQVIEVFQSDGHTLAVATSGGARYRVQLQQACEDIASEPGATMLASEGWVCGVGNEFVATDDRTCPINAVARIDPGEYAAHARTSHTSADGTVTLSTVTVEGKRRHGFAASSNYCLNPRHVRGWSEGPEGLLVEVNPSRSGGNRYYRVELARSCPQLVGGSSMALHSGLGIGLVCGNPGDRVLSGTRMAGPSSGMGSRASAHQPLMLATGRPPEMMMTGSDRLQNLGAKLGCPISAVYPVEG